MRVNVLRQTHLNAADGSLALPAARLRVTLEPCVMIREWRDDEENKNQIMWTSATLCHVGRVSWCGKIQRYRHTVEADQAHEAGVVVVFEVGRQHVLAERINVEDPVGSRVRRGQPQPQPHHNSALCPTSAIMHQHSCLYHHVLAIGRTRTSCHPRPSRRQTRER